MEEENKEEVCYTDKIKAMVVKELEQFSDATDLHGDELDVLYKLVDIDKDLENIDYWNVKKEVMKMRYNNYGEQYEIKSIEYTQFNGKDTIIDYEKDGVTYTARFDGWLSIQQILDELKEIIEK